MSTNTLMLVRTHPQDPARDDEFNEWYNGNHIPDVLNAPNFTAALRYKNAATHIGQAPPYLALYYVTEDDAQVANNELLAYLGAPEPRRMEMPPATGDAEGGLVVVENWAFYNKKREVGHNDVSPEGAAKALLVVYAGPAEGADAEELDRWYDWHVDDILTAPGFRGATRYELAAANVGELPQWCAIYELESDDVDTIQEGLGKVLATAPSGGIPTTADGSPALAVDGYVYYTFLAAPTKVHTLLP